LAALLSYAAYSFSSVTVPDRGGTFVEGVAGNPQYLNPLLARLNRADADLCALLFDGLTRFDQQGNVVPDLAESWKVSQDGLTYDFKLQPGLYWHDDAPVTAADVLYTVSAMQDPDFPGDPSLRALWQAVDVSAPDGPNGLAVRFKLKMQQPFAPFLDYTTMGLLPAHIWQRVPVKDMAESQYNTRPIGTGPFEASRVTATRIDLVPNPRYHGSTPYLTGLTVRFYPDQQSLLPAYERGDIDGISYIPPEDMAWAAEQKDLQVFSAPMSGYTLVYLNQLNPNVPFFKDKTVRQALLYALDRQGIIDSQLDGQGQVANSPILPGTWAYDPDVPKYGYDPARARQLLDQAGWKTSGDGVREQNGKKLSFILVGQDQALIQALAKAWGQIGVQAVPQTVTSAGLSADFLVPRTFEAALVHWEQPGDPDPYPLWHSTQIKDGQNYAGWSDAVADDALEKARALTDQPSRRQYYVAFQQEFADQVPALLLYHPVYTIGVRNKVHDVQIGPFNTPADRYRSIAQWYIVSRRITIGNGPANPTQPAP
jgi:peptide/nickel transport system substrate-binding protein